MSERGQKVGEKDLGDIVKGIRKGFGAGRLLGMVFISLGFSQNFSTAINNIDVLWPLTTLEIFSWLDIFSLNFR